MPRFAATNIICPTDMFLEYMELTFLGRNFEQKGDIIYFDATARTPGHVEFIIKQCHTFADVFYYGK